MEWAREEILTATGGEMIRRGKETAFGDVVTDSRAARKKSVFIALEGERLDGHAFLEQLRISVVHNQGIPQC